MSVRTAGWMTTAAVGLGLLAGCAAEGDAAGRDAAPAAEPAPLAYPPNAGGPLRRESATDILRRAETQRPLEQTEPLTVTPEPAAR